MRRPPSVWWLWPSSPLIVVVASTLVAANAIDPEVYRRAWRTPKALDTTTTIVLLAGVVALVAGAALAGLAERRPDQRPDGHWPALSSEALDVMRRVYPWLMALTFLGYAVWIGMGIRRGLTYEDVRTVLATQDNIKLPIKDKLETLPGVTTLTQVAITAAIIGVILDLHRPSAAVRWAYRFVVLLAAARALILAERLAVAELLVPILVVRAATLSARGGRSSRNFLRVAPALGVVILVGGFAASEFSRSWTWYSDVREQSFAEFSSERLLGYYATSHNNGALLLNEGSQFSDLPYYSTTFVWEIPPGSVLGGDIADDAADDRRRLLNDYGNPEFNSPSGLASVFADYGLPGGLAFYFGIGLAIGAIHLSFIHGRLVGVLLYPIVFVGLLELPRYLYWFVGRAVPALVVSFALIAYLGVRARWRVQSEAYRVLAVDGLVGP